MTSTIESPCATGGDKAATLGRDLAGNRARLIRAVVTAEGR